MTDKTQALLPVTRHPTQIKGNCPTCGHGQSHSLPSPVLALVAGYADYTAISDDRWEQGKAAGYRELGGLVAAALTPSATMEGVMRAAAISSSEHRYDASALSGDALESAALDGLSMQIDTLREALDAAHYYIDASPEELAAQGLTRDDALRIAREKRPFHQGAE